MAVHQPSLDDIMEDEGTEKKQASNPPKLQLLCEQQQHTEERERD